MKPFTVKKRGLVLQSHIVTTRLPFHCPSTPSGIHRVVYHATNQSNVI